MVYEQTIIHPLAFIITLFAGILICFLPRKYAFIPFISVGIFISLQQRILIGGADFTMLRLLILFGLARIFLRSEYQALNSNEIDRFMLWFVFFRTITYTLLWQTSGAFINRLGGAIDIIGLYFFMRVIIHDFEDIYRVLKTFLIICLLLAMAMLIEWKTGRNLFSIFGGVSEITMVRDGRLRCQGAFQHPILAGSFGASLFPIFLSFWWHGERSKKIAIFGCLSTAIITITSSSSGPALAFLVGLFGLAMWPFRKKMRAIRWGILLTLGALHIVMNAPVWALIARVKVFGSSTGYHRYLLIDQFISRFKEWCLFGTKSTAHWGEFGKLWDITNNFIRIAVSGGLVTLVLFIIILGLCFRTIGRALRTQKQRKTQIFLWSIGTSLLVHITSFMGVSYFDQIIVLWYSLIAIISVIYCLTNDRYIQLKEKNVLE